MQYSPNLRHVREKNDINSPDIAVDSVHLYRYSEVCSMQGW